MMKSPRKKIRSLLVVVLSVAGAASGIWGCRRWHGTHEPPEARLALDAYYPEMPPDANHRYLNLPMDYTDESSGRFRAFYVLSTNFNPKDPVVFFLTDGQMELVGPEMDFSFFDEQLPGVSYVLIGHRGHCPTLFPEVYPDGKLDLRRAMNLYGSWQRVEDIERVRKDMVFRETASVRRTHYDFRSLRRRRTCAAVPAAIWRTRDPDIAGHHGSAGLGPSARMDLRPKLS
ncbi:hypothetical protein ABIF26_004852 [Bradyrhizobium elkanii]|uniref:hypothetical protein n=1 Tax=Bradyrhizobium elkanii TaxID=29448 RepID=UPI003513F39F